jgi:uncharacterized membrane protein YgcG
VKLLLRLAVLFACASGVAAAKSFELVNLRQDVYFLGDGSVRVVDSRTYDFNGSFSFAQTTIEPRDGGSVRFEGATATDGKPAPASSVQGNTLRLDFSARDEQRSFQFAYTLRGDLDVANDVVQFDRQLLTSRNPAVSNYTVVLHAPAPNPQPFRVFVFTGNSRVGTLTFNDRAGTATMNLSRVSEDEFVRVRAFLPTAQFPTAANTIAKDAFGGWLEEIARDTQGFRDASRAALERGGFAPPPPPPPAWLLFLPFVSVIFIGANIVLAYQRYGREPVTEEVGRYYREPAEDIPPSMVPYVMTQTSPGKSAIGRAVGATLLDFARRGHVKLERTRTSGFFGIGAQDVTSFAIATPPDRAQVTPFEAQLWNTLVDARGVDNAVTPTELKNAFTSRPSLAQTLADMPRQTYEAVHGPLLDAQMGAKGAPWTVAAFLAGAASLFGGFFLIQWLTSVAVGLMIAGALNILAGVIGSVALPRWNADKLLNAKRWAAYRNFLTDFSAMNTAPAEHLKLWDYHFVYASALGVAQSYLHNVKRLAEAHPDYYFTPTWIGYYAAGNLGAATGAAGVADSLTALNSLSSIATNLTQLENSLNPSSNSSGGGFGGGSFGGSGGGGSSSAG